MAGIDLDRLNPAPLTFGRCAGCPYRDVGSAAVCFACARRGLDMVGGGHCRTCGQRLPESGRCSNFWCGRPEGERFFSFIYAIAMRSGPLLEAINRYKFRNARGWAAIFGRVLVGYLEALPAAAEGWDVIIPSPTYLGKGSRRTWDHIALILERAQVEAGGRLPVHVGAPLIVKQAETPSLVGMTFRERRQTAESEIRQSLRVSDPVAVRDARILVFDDVFTDGSTLREVARALIGAGASQVSGLVLARQPWSAG